MKRSENSRAEVLANADALVSLIRVRPAETADELLARRATFGYTAFGNFMPDPEPIEPDETSTLPNLGNSGPPGRID